MLHLNHIWGHFTVYIAHLFIEYTYNINIKPVLMVYEALQ